MSKDSSIKDLSISDSDWMESKENIIENEPESLRAVILNLLQKSSIYAVSQLVTSIGFGRRILWLIVLVVGFSGCSYEIYRFLSLYFQYPVVITLEVKNNWKLDFPAVTVCNLNRIPNRYYHCLLKDIPLEKCKKSKRLRPVISERRRFATCSKEYNGTFSGERSRSLTFMNKFLKLGENSRKDYGYDASDFITSCTFNGESCSVSNFTEFSSIEFGNCFTFNAWYTEDGKALQTPYIGPNSGLELTLHINTDSYAPITASVGARVVIHESDVEPNPEDNGINISPGYETSVAIQQTSIYRLPDPYRDKCKQYSGGKASERNQEGCLRNCMQNINLHHCGCVDPFLSTESSMSLCDLRNQSAVCCLDDVMNSFSEKNISCSCPLPCKSTDYEMTISTAEWPSKRFFIQFLKQDYEKGKLQTKMSRIQNAVRKAVLEENATSEETNIFNSMSNKNSNECCDECICQNNEVFEEYRQLFAKFKVFYKSLEKTYYKQEPMFQDSELFSQLGGQLGLWLGISLVALFECIENLTHLVHYFFKKAGKPNRVNSYFRGNSFKKTTTKV